MEPALLVIGLNHHTAPEEIRARFAMDAAQRAAALRELSQADGVEEALVISCEDHTGFLLWASDPAVAASSVLHLLSQHFELKLCEWRHFFRLLHQEALVHCFRVAAGLDSLPGAPTPVPPIEKALCEGRQAGTVGPYIDTVVRRALAIAARLHGDSNGAPIVDGDVREAQNLIAAEARACHRELESRHLVPAIASLRNRLEEICRQEIDSFGQDAGPFPHEQRELLTAFAPRIAQRIAGSLAREFKNMHNAPEPTEEEVGAGASKSRAS